MTQRARGFTVVEVLVVLVLIGILLALALVKLSSSQVGARDDTTRMNAETIARGIEEYFKLGNPNYSIASGRYPSVDEFRHAAGEDVPSIGSQVTGGYLDTWLSGAKLPTTSKLRIITTTGQQPENSVNISDSTPAEVVTYEPLMFVPAGGGNPDRFDFCMTKTDECVKFNIYYRSESDNAIHTIRSEHQ